MILKFVGYIERRLQGVSKARFLADRDEIDLTAYRLSVIGKSAGKLLQDIRAQTRMSTGAAFRGCAM
jgi:uncharacterized protein with HEPN domain